MFTTALVAGWRPAEQPFITAIITLEEHPEGTDIFRPRDAQKSAPTSRCTKNWASTTAGARSSASSPSSWKRRARVGQRRSPAGGRLLQVSDHPPVVPDSNPVGKSGASPTWSVSVA